MTTPSNTVQAAQKLLADREAVGLAKYGTTVDRTDLQAGDWLQHAIEEASDLLLYLIRLRETMPVTMREAVGELSRPAPAEDPAHAAHIAGWLKAEAEADHERAAYLKRWSYAPEGATHLSEDDDGCADWWQGHPVMGQGNDSGIWVGGSSAVWAGAATTSILDSVRCEPRPEVQP